jgi:hypothetical protein
MAKARHADDEESPRIPPAWEDLLDAEDRLIDLESAATVHCPYCGEAVEMALDPAGGGAQQFVQDCEVCCQPWRVSVSWDADGVPWVDVEADDGR